MPLGFSQHGFGARDAHEARRARWLVTTLALAMHTACLQSGPAEAAEHQDALRPASRQHGSIQSSGVQLQLKLDGYNLNSSARGVLISPTDVLTSAHVVFELATRIIDTPEIWYEVRGQAAENRAKATRYTYHPGISARDLARLADPFDKSFPDLAVLHLEQALQGTSARVATGPLPWLSKYMATAPHGDEPGAPVSATTPRRTFLRASDYFRSLILPHGSVGPGSSGSGLFAVHSEEAPCSEQSALESAPVLAGILAGGRELGVANIVHYSSLDTPDTIAWLREILKQE